MSSLKKSMEEFLPHINCMSGCRFIVSYGMFILIVIFCCTGRTDARGSVPFHEGEKLTYHARWGPVPAGVSILEVRPATGINGVPAYHFSMITRTNRYIDLVYKVRERQGSYVDMGFTHSLLYTKQSTGKHPRDVVVDFDWDRMTASYNNFGEEMSPVSILPGTFDPLSLVYVIRLYDLAEGMVFTIPVTDGKKCIPARAKVSRREVITIAEKEYDTFLVESDLKALNKDGDDSNLKIWFTANERKIPIRMQLKKHVIEFTFDIIAEEK